MSSYVLRQDKKYLLNMICYWSGKENPSVLLPNSIPLPSTGGRNIWVKEIDFIKGTAKATPWILTSMNDRELTV